jgi:D-alanine-D-alanine ligase
MTGRWKNATVALLLGGPSSEREVSLKTGAAIAQALRALGYTIVEIDPTPDVAAQLRAANADVVYNALHGTYAEDGRLQGLLDWMGLPYTGEDARTALVTFDKVLSLSLAAEAGVPVAPGVSWASATIAERTLAELPMGLPVVVKPAAEGSSVGVSLVRTSEAFMPALLAAASGRDVVVEAYISGPELSVGVLDGVSMGTAEIVPDREFYDYEAKYGEAGTQYFVPARIDPGVAHQIERHAERAVAALGCQGVVRVDFLLGVDGPVFLEINTLPGMTGASLLPKIAEGVGLSFGALCEAILDRARCARAVRDE